MGQFLELIRRRIVQAGGIGDIKPSLFIEVRRDGPIHQRWPRNQFDLKPIGNGNDVITEFEIGGEDAGRGAGRRQREGDQQRLGKTGERTGRAGFHGPMIARWSNGPKQLHSGAFGEGFAG